MKSFCLVLTILLPFSQQAPISGDIWTQGDEMITEMDTFRRDYSSRGFKLFGDIKTNIMDSDDTYFSESQTAYESAGLMQTLLSALIKVQQTVGTKAALNKILDDATLKLSTDIEKLEESIHHNDEFITKAKGLKSQFHDEFIKESTTSLAKFNEMREVSKTSSTSIEQRDKIQRLMEKMRGLKRLNDELTKGFDENIKKIDGSKEKLKNEIVNIDNLRSKIDPIKTLLNADTESSDDLQKAAQDLIAECDKYRHEHDL